MRSTMKFQSKRELLAQVAPRYRETDHAQKSVMLSEFIAATGYKRKYAIRLLSGPILSPPAPLKRSQARCYGPAVQEALAIAWAAANYICAKRLVPFLPELVPTLERHGHLQLTDKVRALVLDVSPATADRLLQPLRQKDAPRGLSTTRVGRLLKHQIPIRTFNDWNETRPGFLEADLVAHCGWTVEGSFLNTLVLTDVASGWTECLALLQRSQAAVVQALDRVQQLLPKPMLGLDIDNGSEFINGELLAYCERTHLTFTRGRACRKNDQCYVEQKNGAIVRQFVGYDRYEGERAYRQLTELYRALLLYVNFFQPSMKLLTKQRDQGKMHRKYAPAQTPLRRLLATDVVQAEIRTRLETIYQSLDPIGLLHQIATLQDALWPLALFESPAAAPEAEAPTSVRFRVEACRSIAPVANATEASEEAVPLVSAERLKRKYHRTHKPSEPRWWRTRADPFEAVWEELRRWFSGACRPGAPRSFSHLTTSGCTKTSWPGKPFRGRYRPSMTPGPAPATQCRSRTAPYPRERRLLNLHVQDRRSPEPLFAGDGVPCGQPSARVTIAGHKAGVRRGLAPCKNKSQGANPRRLRPDLFRATEAPPLRWVASGKTLPRRKAVQQKCVQLCTPHPSDGVD
jgi:hypothetical protein